MRNNLVRRAAIVAAAAGVAVLGASSLPGTATAAPATEAPAAQAPAAAPAHPVKVDRQAGVVIEGFTTIHGQEVNLSVYDNSQYGSSANVVIGDPEDGGAFGYAEQGTPFVVNGILSVAFDVDGKPATLTGTVVADGKPTRINESMQDGGNQLVTKGTNTPMLATVTLTFDGESVPVQIGTAFGYDLQVRTVALYGN